MSVIVIWIVAGVIVIAIVGLFAVLPFSPIPRRPRRPDEPGESVVNEAQNEAELFYRRQPPVG